MSWPCVRRPKEMPVSSIETPSGKSGNYLNRVLWNLPSFHVSSVRIDMKRASKVQLFVGSIDHLSRIEEGQIQPYRAAPRSVQNPKRLKAIVGRAAWRAK